MVLCEWTSLLVKRSFRLSLTSLAIEKITSDGKVFYVQEIVPSRGGPTRLYSENNADGAILCPEWLPPSGPRGQLDNTSFKKLNYIIPYYWRVMIRL